MSNAINTQQARNHNGDAIERARKSAHDAIEEAYPMALEVEEATEAMYEFDAIAIDNEECGVSEIAVMHDFDRNTYALVERPRPNAALIHEAEKQLRISDLLQQIELKVMMLSMACETESEIAAAWAAVTATASSSMRIRLNEAGCDADRAMRQVERFLLTNPQ